MMAKFFPFSIIVFIAISTVFAFDDIDSSKCSTVRYEDRIDCHPDPPVSRENCLERKCCWQEIENSSITDQQSLNLPILPKIGIPSCYFGKNYVGYRVENSDHSSSSSLSLNLKRIQSSGFLFDIKNVKVNIEELSDKVVRIRFTDNDDPNRFEVPIPKLNLPKRSSSSSPSLLYNVSIVDNNRLIIRRLETNQSIIDINLAQLIYSDQFIQVTTRLPSNYIYGIGEHRAPFRKSTYWTRYTQWVSGLYPRPDHALYGNHPFYLVVEDESPSKSASGVFLFNSNAMDIITQPSPAITFRTIGGILDFFVFFGPKPEQVVQQYHSLIGLPAMPPFWSLGFHLSRYGYNNFTNLNETFTRNIQAGVPLDVQWTDIDMFDSFNDFTYDHKQFKELPDFIDNVLHPNGMKFIPMFDCGISAGEQKNSYRPYDYGIEMDLFIKNSTDQLFLGKVWNKNTTVWPDFSHPNAIKYWTDMFAEYYKTIKFDGAWIDMNEPTSFWSGQENGCPEKSRYENPQYVPGMVNENLTLRYMTLCMTAKHYHEQLHYNLHNLYSLSEAIATNAALTNLKKRPFILSRATAPGHGHWASHWDGDIVSDWSSMLWSIPSILNFNLFGIPMVGADICGFNLSTTVELCTRWHQLGAFYTFARNHNDIYSSDQDPAALGGTVLKAAVSSLSVRYVLLLYLYTLFYNVHQNGGTVLRPMFFEFPDDKHSYEIETQFMWGDSILIAPILYPNQTEHKVYLPKGTWLKTDQLIIKSQGQYFTIQDRLDLVNYVFFRGGSIIPLQHLEKNTKLMNSIDFGLFVILDRQNSSAYAKGSLYLDSGDSLDPVKNGQYNFYNFEAKNNTLLIQSEWLGHKTLQNIDPIIIFEVLEEPISIRVNGNESIIKGFSYNKNEKSLYVPTKLPIYNEKSSSTTTTNDHHRIHYLIEW